MLLHAASGGRSVTPDPYDSEHKERRTRSNSDTFLPNVTAQVPFHRSDGFEGADQRLGILHEGVEDIPPLLFGSREGGSNDSEVRGAGVGAESSGDFLP